MSSPNESIPKVNYKLVANNLNLGTPKYVTWHDIVDHLNEIELPQNHTKQNACSGTLACKYPPGPLNTGVPRVLMPEVNKDVLEKLKGKIDFTEHKMTVQQLADSYVAQREILLPKIQGQASFHEEGKFNLLNNTWYIATASDGKKVIIDGHHGWGALNILLNKKSPTIDPAALVNVVDFNETPEKVIEMSFYQGDAHSNPFRPSLVKGGYKRRSRRSNKTNKTNKRNRRRERRTRR